MKHLFTFYTILFSILTFGQIESKIKIQDFNYRYLEHLVKIGVDEVRKNHDLKPLINDSILFVASNHHANYLVRYGRLSHNEVDSTLTKTPQDRADYFGAINYRVGENILYTPYQETVKGKDNKVFDTNTYQGLADAMVNSWVNSPGHFKNIITADYELTGLAITIDTKKKRAYACQKFAIADYQYSFLENTEMFPYSNYVPAAIANSFDGIDDQLINGYNYDYNLRHDKKEDCVECDQIVNEVPFLTLRIDRNKFILRVEDSDYIKHLVDKRKDGFAVEIVNFDDYMCGNPNYYTNPSRRNGQLELNGKTLEPVLKNELFKGYKKRKKRKDVKFLSYIFKSDSVKFFKRFGRYKLDRYNYQYYELSLGRVPRDINGYWAYNLVYIQDDQICHIDYFTGYCGEIITDFQPTEFIPHSAVDNCAFLPEDLSLNFIIPFEKNKSEFTNKDIDPFLQSISELSYNLDSVSIRAYASIEGEKAINRNLQTLRAQNIASVLKVNQDQNVPVNIRTNTDWEGFYKSVSSSKRWNYLKELSKLEVINELDNIGYDDIEPILKTQRRGEIDLYCTINVDEQNLEYFIKKDFDIIHQRLDSLAIKRLPNDEVLKAFNLLYECTHSKVVQGKVAPEFLAAVEMPMNYRDNHTLTQNFIMYGYEFDEQYTVNNTWQTNHKTDEEYIQTECSNPEHVSPAFNYLLVRNALEACQEKGAGDLETLQKLLNRLDELQTFYTSNSIAEKNIDRLNFNLNVLLLNYVFSAEPLKYTSDAIKSIAQLHQFYEKYNVMTGAKAIELGRTAVEFQQISTAYGLLRPYATEDSVLAYMLPLGYQHISSSGSIGWYEKVISMSNQMDENIWCNMFFGECEIPMQALDYEPLRNVFCEKCMDKNDLVLELLGNTEQEASEP